MTETQNVATYARIRPYNPAINEDKTQTARCLDGDKVLNKNGDNEDTYNFTKVFADADTTEDVFNKGMLPLLKYKILNGITSIFIVYGQSGSGKSFTLIGEPGHLGVLPMSLNYLLDQTDKVSKIEVSSIEAYGVKSTKINFFDLVKQWNAKQKDKKGFDPWNSPADPRVTPKNAQSIAITKDNCLQIITELQEVSHMAPTLKNPHSSRGHTVYFCRVVMRELEDTYFIAVDLAGSEGQTALGTQDEFVEGLKLAMAKGKLNLGAKAMKNIVQMYKTRSLEAGCINNGLTQLQSIFGELIRKKISKSQGLGLRKILSQFITLKSAYAILFTLSASANNNKVTRATLNFAKQTQLVKVQTTKAKKKIDKDAIIKKLQQVIEDLQKQLETKDKEAMEYKQKIDELTNQVSSNQERPKYKRQKTKVEIDFEQLKDDIKEAELEEAKWEATTATVDVIKPTESNQPESKDTGNTDALYDDTNNDNNDDYTEEYNRQLVRKMTQGFIDVEAMKDLPEFKDDLDDDESLFSTDEDYNEIMSAANTDDDDDYDDDDAKGSYKHRRSGTVKYKMDDNDKYKKEAQKWENKFFELEDEFKHQQKLWDERRIELESKQIEYIVKRSGDLDENTLTNVQVYADKGYKVSKNDYQDAFILNILVENYRYIKLHPKGKG